MRSGETFRHRPEGVPGDPDHPVSAELLEAKFRDCASFSARPLAAADIERVIELVGRLETLDDVSDVVKVIAPGEEGDKNK